MIHSYTRVQRRTHHIMFKAVLVIWLFCDGVFAQKAFISSNIPMVFDPCITGQQVITATGFQKMIYDSAQNAGIKDNLIESVLKDFEKPNSGRIIRPEEWRHAVLELLYKNNVPYPNAEKFLQKVISRPVDTGFINELRRINSGEMAGNLMDVLKDARGVYKPGDGVVAPVVSNQALPWYTDTARKARVEGSIVMQCIIRKNGTFSNPRILWGLGYGLDESAIRTVRDKWHFKPGVRNGEPVDVQIQIELSFQLY